jgi:hypothetical protein
MAYTVILPRPGSRQGIWWKERRYYILLCRRRDHSCGWRVWPADIAHTTVSSDITTIELGDAWAYLGAGLYLEVKG